MADSRKLIVEVIGDTSNLERSFKRAGRQTDLFGRRMNQTTRGVLVGTGAMRGLGRSVAFASGAFLGAAGLGAAAKLAFDEMLEGEAVAADTAATLKSTGAIAGVTAEQIEALGTSLQQLTGYDDEAIRSAQNLLLTFTNIRNVAGKNNDIFTQTTRATLDLSRRFDQDLSTSAVQLGKALNDPVAGLTALRRIGISFSAAQQRLIRRLVESGRLLEAQKVLLAEVTRETGGAAEAYGKTLPGQLDILQGSLTNLAGELAKTVNPQVKLLTERFNKWLANPENKQKIIDGFASGTGAIGSAAEDAANAFVELKDAYEAFKDAGDELPGGKDGFFDKLLTGNITTIVGLLRENVQGLQDDLDRLGVPGANTTREDLLGGRDVYPITALESMIGRGTISRVPGFSALEGGTGGVGRGAVRPGEPPKPDVPKWRRSIAEMRKLRNQWFDAMIGRRLDRVQDIAGLRGQKAELGRIADVIRAQMTIVKDVTRRLNLEDTLLSVLREQKAVQDQITDGIKEANQALKERADAIKSAILDRLQRRQTDVLNRRALEDARERLRIARQLGGAGAIEAARRGVQDVNFDIQRARLERAPASLGGGRFALGNVITINVNGSDSPEAVAQRVVTIMQRKGRHATKQRRGPYSDARVQ